MIGLLRHINHVKRLIPVMLFWFTLGVAVTCPAQTPPSAAAARAVYERAKSIHSAKPGDPESIVHFGRAVFDWAEHSPTPRDRAQLAAEAIAPLRSLLQSNPTHAGAHFYLALNLGQLARTRGLSALRMVTEIESEFKTARGLDPKFDRAGPDRFLGKLYQDAPSWPASIGSRSKSRQHFENAVKLMPEHPENHLCLIEALIDWSERKAALAAAQAAAPLLAQMPAALRESAWVADRNDWLARWRTISRTLKLPAPK